MKNKLTDMLEKIKQNGVSSQMKDNMHGLRDKNADVVLKSGFDVLALVGATNTKSEYEMNDPMYTTRTGFGEELVPVEVFTKEIYESIPEYQSFLNQIKSSFHGNNLPEDSRVRVKGRPGLMNNGAESTTSPFTSPKVNTHDYATAKIPLVMKQFVSRIDITDQLSQFNAEGPDKFLNDLKARVGAEVFRTEEAAIINADPTTAGTGNINSDDAAPAANDYYLGRGKGLRKTAFDIGGTAFADLTALATDDFRTLEKVLAAGRLWNPADCFWLLDQITGINLTDLTHFTNADERGGMTTIAGADVKTFDGAPIFKHQDVALTEADGKISTVTPANNTQGQLGLVNGPAIQWGRHGGIQMKVYDYGADGYQLETWEYFGFTIIDRQAGQISPPVAWGYNITP